MVNLGDYRRIFVAMTSFTLPSETEINIRVRCGCDRMVVGFTTTCAISTYHHYSCEFKTRSWWGVVDTKLCDKVCQWLVAVGLWFCLGIPFTNKTDHYDINETLLKVALNTINLGLKSTYQLANRHRIVLYSLLNLAVSYIN